VEVVGFAHDGNHDVQNSKLRDESGRDEEEESKLTLFVALKVIQCTELAQREQVLVVEQVSEPVAEGLGDQFFLITLAAEIEHD